MVEAGVAKEFTEPVCIDGNGCECEEEKSYGRKVTHIITHPEMCIIRDEVDTNTSQKGDGHKGVVKFLVQKGSTPLIRASTKECHSIVMGMTELTGEPVMCVCVLRGIKEEASVEVGFDKSAE